MRSLVGLTSLDHHALGHNSELCVGSLYSSDGWSLLPGEQIYSHPSTEIQLRINIACYLALDSPSCISKMPCYATGMYHFLTHTVWDLSV